MTESPVSESLDCEPDRDRWLGGRPNDGVRLATGLIWLLFIIFPVADAISSSAPLGRHLLTIFGATAFVGAYAGLVFSWRQHDGGRFTWSLLFVELALASALTIVDGAAWGFLFTYCAACAGISRPRSAGFGLVLVSAAAAAATGVIAGGKGSGGDAIGFAASSLGIGLLLSLMADLRDSNRQLANARGELARLAVTAERERFARDLHDLLGHSLSVITLKAELAGRLLPARPAEAAREVSDVEHVARQALGEVRDAVGGYRKPTLDRELEGARMALSAAGIEAVLERPSAPLPEDVEAVLAWTVREGATNVIRHSGAQRCTVTVAAGGEGASASVEVVDDGAGHAANGHTEGGGSGGAACVGGGFGAGSAAGSGVGGGGSGVGGGSGLAGLAARVDAVEGTLEAGRQSDGRYRLRVTVPR